MAQYRAIEDKFKKTCQVETTLTNPHLRMVQLARKNIRVFICMLTPTTLPLKIPIVTEADKSVLEPSDAASTLCTP